MKDKTIKNIRLCCCIALAFCVVWAVYMLYYFFAVILCCSTSAHSIDWSVNTTMRIIILVSYFLGNSAMVVLCIKVILNTFKGLRENTVFPKSNIKLMFWMALADFVYLLGFGNLSILWDENTMFQLQSTNFVSPFFLLFFAFMYKVAADAVEENNLTV